MADFKKLIDNKAESAQYMIDLRQARPRHGG